MTRDVVDIATLLGSAPLHVLLLVAICVQSYVIRVLWVKLSQIQEALDECLKK